MAISNVSVAFTVSLIFMTVVSLYVVFRVKNSDWQPKIRRITGLDHIEEAVGRATEMGKPVHFSPGVHDITVQTAPQTFAGLAILGYVAQLCARLDVELICTIMRPNVYPLADAIVRQKYLEEGKIDRHTDRTVRYLGEHDQAYAYGVYGIMRRERPAANIMMGGFDGTAVGFAENAAITGSISVAGTAQLPQIPFFVASCDYTLIGEELYAAGAYLSKDRDTTASICGQDVVKAVVIVLLLIGTITTTFGSNAIQELLLR